MAIENIARLIRDEALRLGFDDVGFSPATEIDGNRVQLQQWLDNGYHAGMGYMANHFEKRLNPAKLVEGAESVITLLLNYNPVDDSLSRGNPKISRYAYGTDYHRFIKGKLYVLADFIRLEIDENIQISSFVDSAPLLERSIAARAGLGWIGKNSMFIHRKLGSYVFIAELILNIQLPYSKKNQIDRCGNCTRCMDACPTQAILPGRQVDANRCISYLTIENKGEIPLDFKGTFNGWAFGCDACQEVCPWNKRATPCLIPELQPSKALIEMSSESWTSLTSLQFDKLFASSAIKRAKFNGLKRNINFVALKTNENNNLENSYEQG